MKSHAFETFPSLRMFDYDDLQASSIDLADICWVLSKTPRWMGHIPNNYSVAEHSYMASLLVHNPLDILCALLHDAAEAYMCDIPTPLKRHPCMDGYAQMECYVGDVINKKLIQDITGGNPDHRYVVVKKCDMQMLLAEMVRFGKLDEMAKVLDYGDYKAVDSEALHRMQFSLWDNITAFQRIMCRLNEVYRLFNYQMLITMTLACAPKKISGNLNLRTSGGQIVAGAAEHSVGFARDWGLFTILGFCDDENVKWSMRSELVSTKKR